MGIQLNEYWTLERSADDIQLMNLGKRIQHCSDLIKELREKILLLESIRTERYEEFLLYIKTLRKIEDEYNHSSKLDLALLENRLDILQDRLSSMYLIYKINKGEV